MKLTSNYQRDDSPEITRIALVANTLNPRLKSEFEYTPATSDHSTSTTYESELEVSSPQSPTVVTQVPYENIFEHVNERGGGPRPYHLESLPRIVLPRPCSESPLALQLPRSPDSPLSPRNPPPLSS